MKKIYIIALLVINVVFCVSSVKIKEPLDVQLLDAVIKPNNIEEIRGLLEQGADINRQNSWGWSSLHHAADYCYVEYIKFLLARGADVNIKTKSGKIPVVCALFSRNEVDKVEAIKLFFECGIDLSIKCRLHTYIIDYFAKERDCLILLLTETVTLKDHIATMRLNANHDINLLKPKALDLINLVNNLKLGEDSNVDFDSILEKIKKKRKKVASLIYFDNVKLKYLLYNAIPDISVFEQTRLQIMKNILKNAYRVEKKPLMKDILAAQSFQELPIEIKEKAEISIIREFLVGDEEFTS